MSFKAPRIAFSLALVSIIAFSPASVSAQEIAASHMNAARSALTATKATDSFDGILINAATILKNQLTARDPNKADAISVIVDEEAIALAARRGDLETEAARLFANTFSEAELKDLAKFFGSPVGSKYLESAPILARELSKSARVWANGISRDLNASVIKRVEAETK